MVDIDILSRSIYKLVERQPVRVLAAGPRSAFKAFYTLFQERFRAIAETGTDPWNVAKTKVGDVTISTMFVGLDHSGGKPTSRPLLFETMIFGGKHDRWQDRCSTWEEAEAMHERAVAMMAQE